MDSVNDAKHDPKASEATPRAPSINPRDASSDHTPMPSDERLETLVEALLFVAERPAAIGDLARTLDVEPDTVRIIVDRLAASLRRRGIHMQSLDGRVQLVSAPEAAPYVERFLQLDTHSRLSPAAIETLAIAAYRQPITRPQVEAVRGVNSDSVLRSLVARGLIEPVGRLEQAGRPILYATTQEFLQYFGLQDLGDLPPMNEDNATV